MAKITTMILIAFICGSILGYAVAYIRFEEDNRL
jgi:hypothetical protein